MTLRWYMYEVSRRRHCRVLDLDTTRDLIRALRRAEKSGGELSPVSAKLKELLPLAIEAKTKWVAYGKTIAPEEEIEAHERARKRVARETRVYDAAKKEEMKAKREQQQQERHHTASPLRD